MVSFRKNTRKGVSFRGENNEKNEEDANQAANNSAKNLAQNYQGLFVIYVTTLSLTTYRLSLIL